MSFSLPSYRVRLQSDYAVAGSIIDRLTQLPLKLPKASKWKVEVGIFAGLNGSAPSAATQIPDPAADGWVALTLTFQSSAGVNVVSKTTGTFATPTFTTWNADTGQHCTIDLTATEANITPGIYNVTVTVDSYVVGTGVVEVFEAYNLNSLSPADTNPGAPISQDSADVRYLRFMPNIVGYTGGGATKLDGFTTVGVTAGLVLSFVLSDGWHVAQLFSGTTPGGVGIITPADYNASTNAKYWKLQG